MPQPLDLPEDFNPATLLLGKVTENGTFHESRRVASSFTERLPDKRFPQFYVSDVYRFLYASHLREQGRPMPPWLIPEGEVPA